MPNISITVKTIQQKLTIEIEPEATVADLMVAIAMQGGVPLCEQRLTTRDNSISPANVEEQISLFDIVDGSTVHVRRRSVVCKCCQHHLDAQNSGFLHEAYSKPECARSKPTKPSGHCDEVLSAVSTPHGNIPF